MVENTPTADDFMNHGIDYLNIGWSAVLDVLIDLEDAEESLGDEHISEVQGQFWAAAERELATALSLAEQGAEFLIKARICRISPWLLISKSPQDWPKKCDSENVKFALFRTIDAQDLLKVHDTFADKRLSEEFYRVFDSLRRQRNSIVHTVDRNISLTAAALVENILIVSEHLLGPHTWFKERTAFLERDRHTAIYSERNDYRVAREFLAVVELLTPAQLKRFFDFNTRQRRYICPSCTHQDFQFEKPTAQLRPNKPTSEAVYCFACGQTFAVARIDCPNDDCKGNVYYPDEDMCLTCRQGHGDS